MHIGAIILSVVLALGVIILLLARYLAAYSLQIRRLSLEEAREWEFKQCDLSWYDSQEKQDYTVPSEDGYVLHVQRLVNPNPSSRYIILSHGYTMNRYSSLKYAKMYLDLGFQVILYDLRGHGENEPTYCTYSIRESVDLKYLIDDTRRRYPDLTVLGIHGESLGCATSIACLKYKPEIDFVVADCGFSEITSVMQAGLKGMHLPKWLVHVASLFAKLKYGWFYHEMRPIDSLADNQIPILFMHGEADDFILPFHSQNMQKATRGYSELHLIPGATHAASVLTAPEDYRTYVEGFFAEIGVEKALAESGEKTQVPG